MAIAAFVAGSSWAGPQTSFSATVTGWAAGDTMAAAVLFTDGTATVSSWSMTGESAPSNVGTIRRGGPSSTSIQWGLLSNVTGTGSKTITATVSASVTGILVVWRLTGRDTAGAYDTENGSGGTSTSNTCTATASGNGTDALSILSTSHFNPGSVSGWTARTVPDFNQEDAADLADQAAGSISAAWTWGGATVANVASMLLLKGVSGATVAGQTITVNGSVIAGSASNGNASITGQTLTVTASVAQRGVVEQFIPEDLFIFGDTDSNESSMGGQKLFGGYPSSGTNATVNGQTITVNGSVIAGSATGQASATVSGQTLTVNGSVIAGTATGQSNATVSGQTITVNGSVIAGSVSADSSVAGQTIAVNVSVIPGTATGTGDATVNGQTITVNGSVIAGSASATSSASVAGQTVAVTASLIAGAASGQSNATVAGQTLTVAASLIAGGVAVDAVAQGTVLNIAASVIAGTASAPVNATVAGQTIMIPASLLAGAAFGPSAGGQRWRSVGLHVGLRL